MEQKTEEKPTETAPTTAQVPAVIPQQKQPLRAGGQVLAIVPRDMDEAWRLATAVVKAGLAPAGMDSQEQCMVAIMTGMEVGLPPMQAVQSIAVIGKRPTIWGDGAMALVRASGLCEWIEEYEDESDPENPTAVCRSKRKGEKEPVESTFSAEQQKTAGLFGKDIHQKYPKRMRQMRARAFLLRDLYADVLRGLSVREEVQDYDTPANVAPPPIPGADTPKADNDKHNPEQTLKTIESAVAKADERDAAETKEPAIPAADVKEPEIPTGKVTKKRKPRPSRATNKAADAPAAPAEPKRDLTTKEGFLAFIAEEVKKANTGEELDTIWNDTLAPMIEEHDLETQSEAVGIHRARHNELAP